MSFTFKDRQCSWRFPTVCDSPRPQLVKLAVPAADSCGQSQHGRGQNISLSISSADNWRPKTQAQTQTHTHTNTSPTFPKRHPPFILLCFWPGEEEFMYKLLNCRFSINKKYIK